jgi:predicted alpha/beta superfamily hydrolase
MRRAVAGFFLGAVLVVPPVAACAQPAEPAFSLPDTKILSFASKDGSHRFRLLIGLPRDYATRGERFPVIYLLDADFSFALTQDILRHSTDRGQEKEAIVVGIAYPGADTDLKTYERMRTRDYTPSFVAEGGYAPDIQALSGGGPKFLGIVGDELIPFIDSRFRTDPAQRMIVGHSFGALFACYAMLTRPGLFHDYLVVSPSLWYGDRMMFGLARQYIAAHKSLPANAFYAVGSLEASSDHAMVDDLRAWNDLLGGAKLDGYHAHMMVFDGDTHESVFPGALTRGLRVLDDYAGEAAGNTLEQKR